ncbi:hypothetical protein HDF19_19715 [Mucilaginibacter sp. E4BP6]|uniref:hypothetical protein n=1 Tax=Mucilaginibacter sp. E4BP6 TaxID=2723089 RepID=UPI0015CC3376|nr:hypothetical protein [Mucilaginibacter sp. E4BP6]NYE67218.1 NADH:ubiquinone oxidoreductase subunit C [Mucilaginibacter sp. E4BP6]
MRSRRSWLKAILINFREFLWPMLEPDEDEDKDENGDKKKKPDLKLHLSDENLTQAFDLLRDVQGAEDDRRKTIESKASLYISTIGVSTSVVVASSALITGNNDNSLVIKISVFLSFILSVYTFRTVWFSVKALDRGAYNLMGIKEINFKGNKNDYDRHLITSLANKITANYDTINTKVDNFILAQEYFKRAIAIICIYAFVILMISFFIKTKPEQEKPVNMKCVHITKP